MMNCENQEIEINTIEESNEGMMNGVETDKFDFDVDYFLNEIENMDDLNELDDLYIRLQADLQEKSVLLKNIYQGNAELKNDLNSKKFFSGELDKVQMEELSRYDSLRQETEATNTDLAAFHQQEVEGVNKLENEVEELGEEYSSAPRNYHHNNLTNEVTELCNVLADVTTALEQSREELEVMEAQLIKGRELFGDLNQRMTTALNVFEEANANINSENCELSQTIKELEYKVNVLRLEK